MSLLARDTRQCVVCSTTATYTIVSSRYMIEALDFDGRPYETSLLALPHWVQCCGSCKYCARDISVTTPNGGAVCKTPAYQAILNDTSYPYTARQYRAAAHIATLQQQHAEAGWHAIRAMWKCEDMHHPLARMCRSETLAHYINAYQQGQRFAQHNAEECLIIADLYRRNGDMRNASHYNNLAAQGTNSQQMLVLTTRQHELIEHNVTTRHQRPE